MLCGLFINGPYAVITTAVSNDLVRKLTHLCTHILKKIMHYKLDSSYRCIGSAHYRTSQHGLNNFFPELVAVSISGSDQKCKCS